MGFEADILGEVVCDFFVLYDLLQLSPVQPDTIAFRANVCFYIWAEYFFFNYFQFHPAAWAFYFFT